ncbi:MAG: type II secretion system F family protein, partial [Patescibacteria group bacterium]
MAQFRYQAKKINGEIYERTVLASDRLALYKIIREEGGSIVSIQEVKNFKIPFSGGSLAALFGGINNQEKVNFAKSLASMIKAGLSVTRALSVMTRQSKRKPVKVLLSDLEADVNRGTSLSLALAKHSETFSPLFVSMVKAGEESGGVADALAIVSSQMDKSNQLIKKVRGAMIYPAVIISVMIALGVILLIFMVPTLTSTFAGLGVVLPLSTRIVIALSSFFLNHSFLSLMILILLIILAVIFAKNEKAKRLLDNLSIRMPVVGEIVREVEVARTARTLSSLISAGV